MKWIVLCLFPISISACAGIEATKVTGKQGQVSYHLTCSEFNTSLEACKTKAQELCGGPFEVNQRLSHRETYPDSGDGFYMPAKQHLVVDCQSTAM